MARPILSEYGRDTPKKQVAPSSCGGVTMDYKKDVMGYRPPTGPSNINDPKGPGLHGTVYARGAQSAASLRGDGGAGSVGIGGDKRTMGSNRRAK